MVQRGESGQMGEGYEEFERKQVTSDTQPIPKVGSQLEQNAQSDEETCASSEQNSDTQPLSKVDPQEEVASQSDSALQNQSEQIAEPVTPQTRYSYSWVKDEVVPVKDEVVPVEDEVVPVEGEAVSGGYDASAPNEISTDTQSTDTQSIEKIGIADAIATKFKETKLPEANVQVETGSEAELTHETIRKPMSDFERKMLYMKIRDMDDLPTPNEHITQIIRLLQNPEARISEVVAVIEHDQTLVAQILKLINSGFFSMRTTISNVEQAINLLGILQIKKLVYSASIMDMFSKEMQEGFDHAYSCSALMNSLMEQFNIPAASNLPLTMLCHDIGKIVLNKFSPKKCQLAREFSKQKQLPFNWGERHVLGLDHAEIADVLLRKWEMTDDIVTPIINHHCKGVPETYVLETALVQFVDYIDNKARGIQCNELNKHIMAAAGLEVEDDDVFTWIQQQRNFIEESYANQ